MPRSRGRFSRCSRFHATGRAAFARRGVSRRHRLAWPLRYAGRGGAALKQRVRTKCGLAVSVGIAPVENGRQDRQRSVEARWPARRCLPAQSGGVSGSTGREPPLGCGAGDARRPHIAPGSTRSGIWRERIPRAFAELVGGKRKRSPRSPRGSIRARSIPVVARKSYGEENTFARDQRDGDELRGTIVAHAEAVAARLRADQRRACTDRPQVEARPSDRARANIRCSPEAER